MFSENRVVAHSLFIESKRGSGVLDPNVWRLWSYTTKLIDF